jgi:AraC-like DNA-binding protein
MGGSVAARQFAPRGVASVAVLCALAADRGLDPDRCLQDSGIDRSRLADSDAEITASQELALTERIVDALDDPEGAGLDAGARYRLSTYGIWSYALLSSRTVRDAHAVAMEFIDLTYAFTKISAIEEPGELLVRYDDLVPRLPEPVRRFVLERDLAAALTIWREGLAQPISPLRVRLALPVPRDPARFEQVFGVTPEFEADRTVLTMDARLLDMPLPQASELTAKMCIAQCTEILDRRRARHGLSGRVRDELLLDVRRIPTQEEVASRLFMSIRTLRRQLAAEHTTFRALVEDTRQGLAEELLGTGRLTVEQVAERVGYTEASSFVHAFRRWNGMAPRRWAQQQASASRFIGDGAPS